MLKSGGPDMTIVRFEQLTIVDKQEDRAFCQWQAWSGEVSSHVFPLACLKTAPVKMKDQPEPGTP
jgi:uncharacterized protein YodC (DUF2158 family)